MMRFVFVGSEFDKKLMSTTMNTSRAAIPSTVSRTDDTRSTRLTALMRANWISARGSNSKTMKSMIVGSALGTFVQRSENLRNDPMYCVANARMIAPR